jgi:hypothetical protein
MVVVVGSGTLTEQDIRVMGDSEGEFSGFGLMKEHMFGYNVGIYSHPTRKPRGLVR